MEAGGYGGDGSGVKEASQVAIGHGGAAGTKETNKCRGVRKRKHSEADFVSFLRLSSRLLYIAVVFFDGARVLWWNVLPKKCVYNVSIGSSPLKYAMNSPRH